MENKPKRGRPRVPGGLRDEKTKDVQLVIRFSRNYIVEVDLFLEMVGAGVGLFGVSRSSLIRQAAINKIREAIKEMEGTQTKGERTLIGLKTILGE